MEGSNYRRKNETCCSRTTILEKILLAVTATLVLVFIVMLFVMIYLSHRKVQSEETSHVCTTKSCVETAAEVLKKIDPNVNPCDDFYKFACGTYLKNPLPEDKPRMAPFIEVSELVQKQLKSLLEQPVVKTDLRPFGIVKKFYQVCMNKKKVHGEFLPTARKLLHELGGWPVIEGKRWNATGFNWEDMVYKLEKLGFMDDSFFSFTIEPDPRNSTKRLLHLNQPILVYFSRQMSRGFNETIVRAYLDYMVKVTKIYGAEETLAKKEMRDVIELIVALIKITIGSEDLRDATLLMNPMAILDVQQNYPYFNWLKYINGVIHPLEERRLDDIINVKVPKYFKNLSGILKNFSQRTLANFILWQAFGKNGWIHLMDQDLENANMEFIRVKLGASKPRPRWTDCMEMSFGMHAACGSLYVRNFFKRESKSSILEMVENIRNQFIEIVNTNDWMDGITKKRAVEKAKAMSVHIAYPDELFNDQAIEAYYKDLDLGSSNSLMMFLDLSKYLRWKSYSELDKVNDKKDWRKFAFTSNVNAFHEETQNSIEFPAGILQGIYFDSDRPQYMNYGAIGYLVGHEITHGFDDEGRQYDKDGNLVDWWQPKSKAAFAKKAQCIVDQYGNITVNQINLQLDGINTQGENIADNGAVKEAYLAYKKWITDHGAEATLPGLPYTPEQMFWISAGNIWCSVDRTEMLEHTVLSGLHSPEIYRVNVPLMNSKEFSSDFGCFEGSKMNPKHKCTVW